MKDGEIKISQSLAILKYIAKKHNLLHDGTLKGETMANVIEVMMFRRNMIKSEVQKLVTKNHVDLFSS